MRRSGQFDFQLYVAGDAQNSAQAIANLKALCKKHLPNGYQIDVVDVYREPLRALADRIFMTPTLVRRWPLPIRQIVGTLSKTDVVLQALDLAPAAP